MISISISILKDWKWVMLFTCIAFVVMHHILIGGKEIIKEGDIIPVYAMYIVGSMLIGGIIGILVDDFTEEEND